MNNEHRNSMKLIFDRLFKSETPQGGESAFTAQLQFRSGYAIQGVVTVVLGDYETLKMACPSMQYDPRYPNNERFAKKIIAEHYFDYEDVESVIVVRDVDASKLDVAPGKPTIIMGG